MYSCSLVIALLKRQKRFCRFCPFSCHLAFDLTWLSMYTCKHADCTVKIPMAWLKQIPSALNACLQFEEYIPNIWHPFFKSCYDIQLTAVMWKGSSCFVPFCHRSCSVFSLIPFILAHLFIDEYLIMHPRTFHNICNIVNCSLISKTSPLFKCCNCICIEVIEWSYL